MFTNGDKTEVAGLCFIESLMQDVKLLQQQYKQLLELNLSVRLTAIEANITAQWQSICNMEEGNPLPVKAPPPAPPPPLWKDFDLSSDSGDDDAQSSTPCPALTINVPVKCKPLTVRASPPCPGQFTTTPSPAENVKVDDAKPLTAKAPPPCLGQIASPMPAETVNVKVDDAKPIPVKAHPPPLPLKAPPPVTAKVFAGTGPLTAVQVIEHAKQLPVKAPPEFPVKYPPPHCDQGMTAWPDFSPGDL